MPAMASDCLLKCPKKILLVTKLICGIKMAKLMGVAILMICRFESSTWNAVFLDKAHIKDGKVTGSMLQVAGDLTWNLKPETCNL